tara:strand:- start:220 stop:669 length:450 start_codon:yes stop_codon:yes gene_type:complete
MNILCSNKKANFKYTLTKKIEAGVVLEGWEVKSLKSGHGQISESYITIRNQEAFLVNSHLKVLNTSNDNSKLNPTRERKVLLNKKQILTLSNEVKKNGFAIVLTKIYTKKSLIKLEIALGKGKKQQDKRADIKKREWERQKQRVLKKKN